MNNPKLEIPVDSEAKSIKLLYDRCKSGINENGKEWNLYGVEHEGVQKSYFATKKSHEMLQHFEKGDFVNIKHKRLSNGNTMHEVSPANKLINKKNNNTDDAIKWGMAFNNATRLVSSVPLHSDETIEDRVELIKNITPKMFKIACSQPKLESDDKNDTPF
jgi:hypothetical protein